MNTPAETRLRLWMVTAGLSVIAAVLGYAGFAQYLGERAQFADVGPFVEVVDKADVTQHGSGDRQPCCDHP